jgi:hypothetical protein
MCPKSARVARISPIKIIGMRKLKIPVKTNDRSRLGRMLISGEYSNIPTNNIPIRGAKLAKQNQPKLYGCPVFSLR